MKMRIDLRPVLDDPLHVMRVVLYVVCASIVLGPLQQLVLLKVACAEPILAISATMAPAQPPILAGAAEVKEGLLQFAGGTSRGSWDGAVTSVMMSMVFVYLVGPTLLVWGMRARARYRMKDPAAPGAVRIAVALAIGGSSVLSLLPGLGLAYHSTGVYERMVADNAASDELDRMATTLSLMARKAQVAYFVAGEPWQLAGSWQMSDGSKQPALSIVQLIEPGVDALIPDSRHAVIDGKTFEVTVERADSLTLRGQMEHSVMPSAEGSSTTGSGWCGLVVGVTPRAVTMQILQ